MSDVIAVVPLRVLDDVIPSALEHELYGAWPGCTPAATLDTIVCLVRGDDGVDVAEFRGWRCSVDEFDAMFTPSKGRRYRVHTQRPLPGPVIARAADLGDGWADFVDGLIDGR